MIKITQLTKEYTLKNNNQTTAIENINLELDDKGLVFLLGKSGSGKSTLLNIIGGLDRATSGSVLVDGNQLSFLKENDLCNYRNTRIGFVFQDYQLLNELTVYQNIALALEIKGCFSNTLVLQAIEKVGLNGYEERYPTELSGGEKQRVAIARAIVKDPCVILADEPTGNLDDDTATTIMELLKNLSKERLVLVASHNKTFASVYGDRTIELSQGKIISDSQVRKSDHQNFNNKNIVDKPKFALSKQLKLSGRFLKRRVTSIAISAFMAAVIMIILSFAQTIVEFNANEVIKKELKKNSSESVFITKMLTQEQKAYIDNFDIKINCFPEIGKSDINQFKEAGSTGKIHEVLKYNINLSQSSALAGMTTDAFGNSPYILESLGTLIVDEEFLKEKFGDIKYLSKAKKFHPSGVIITDYIADIIILSEQVPYADSYDNLIGEYHWGTTGSSNNVSRGYINGIIDTGYKNKYFDVFSKVKSGKIKSASDLLREEKFIEFTDDVYQKLGFCYSLNPNFVNDAVKNPAWETIWHYALLFDDKELFVSSIPQVRKGSFYDISLEKNEVLMEVTSYNKVFNTLYDESSLNDFEPHTVSLSHYRYFDTDKTNALFSEEIKIVGLFCTDKLQKEGTLIVSDKVYELFAKDYIYTTGLYFNNEKDIDCIINVASEAGYQKNSVYVESVNVMNKAIKVFVPIFKLISMLLCVGVILILTKFSTKMISDKMQNIGILKALGVSSRHITLIFGVQIFLIGILTAIISTMGYYVFVGVANDLMVESVAVFASNRLIPNADYITFSGNIVVQNMVLTFVLSVISLTIPIIRIHFARPVNILSAEK